jgi:endonuclease/exonuclease/phosphatase family metal-dependent hydrolase
LLIVIFYLKLFSFKKGFLFLFFTCCWILSFGNITVGSWNLQHLGARKPDAAIALMAACLEDFDLVALQEVGIREGGAQAVARLADALNRKGQHWDYRISEPTTAVEAHAGESECYAFIWKTAKVKLVGKAYLARSFQGLISREPYIGVFKAGNRQLTLVNFHALPKKKQPEREIKYLKFFPDSMQHHNLIFLGDFNCPQSHSVFGPLKKRGYEPSLQGQKTTLKQECRDGDCLASEYDNIFYPKAAFRLLRSGVVPFYRHFKGDMNEARKLSDHLPVYVELE